MPLLLLFLVWVALSGLASSANAITRADVVDAAFERTLHDVTYDGSYYVIPYPNGDVPANIGVCTDVVIRAYRSLGIDLQKFVHEDIRANVNAYPIKRIWGQNRPDKNIDHRRVPNLRTFFSRFGESIEPSARSTDYQPGDIVTWMLPGNLPHIGIVSDQYASDGAPLIIHNIGAGPQLDNMLFSYRITGQYRYFPSVETANSDTSPSI